MNKKDQSIIDLRSLAHFTVGFLIGIISIILFHSEILSLFLSLTIALFLEWYEHKISYGVWISRISNNVFDVIFTLVGTIVAIYVMQFLMI